MNTTPARPPQTGPQAPADTPAGPDPAAEAVPAQETSCASETNVRPAEKSVEIGGREGPDPTRYGDWEKAGRCVDF